VWKLDLVRNQAFHYFVVVATCCHLPKRRTVRVYQIPTTAYKSTIWELLSERYPLFQPGWVGNVVGVLPRNVGAVGKRDALIERSRQTDVSLVFHQINPGVLILTDNVSARIRRSIVDNQEFEICERLAQDAVHGLVQIVCAVVYAHKDSDHRVGWPALRVHIGGQVIIQYCWLANSAD
jgi:hypothetical protein